MYLLCQQLRVWLIFDWYFLDSVPFKDFLVHPEANHMCQAEYVRKIEAPPDWGIIFESPPKSHDQDESSVYSLVEDFERIKLSNIKAKLDDTQLDAIDLALKNKVALIQVWLRSTCWYFWVVYKILRVLEDYGLLMRENVSITTKKEKLSAYVL